MSDSKDEFQNWSIPDLSKTKDESQETSLFGKPATWYNSSDQRVEEVEQEEVPQPLTLEDIEAVRQSAYEDGFNEGKEAGLIQGLEEGKLEGLAAGHQEGLKQGHDEGLELGAIEIAEQLSLWQALLQRLHQPLEKLDDSVEYQLIRLATQLAEQITRSELITNPQIILQALKQGVDALPISEQKLIINLHPDDLIFVQNAYSPEQCLQRGWNLQAEPTLARGDCQIHTQVSSIDYAFNTRVEQVLKNFFKNNHEQLPNKNDDSNLLNDQAIKPSETAMAKDEQAPLDSENITAETSNE